MTESAELISGAIARVDLSSPNGSKWDEVRALVSSRTGLPSKALYLTYISKPGNTQVRLGKQIAGDNPVRMAIGVCGTPGTESKSYPVQAERVIRSHPTLSCVVFMWDADDGGGEPDFQAKLCFHIATSPEAEIVRDIWSDAEFHVIDVGDTSENTPSWDGMLDWTSDTTIRLLRERKNVVLEGVPGTGKTYAIRAIAEGWTSFTQRQLAEPYIVVLHPSSSYEDLVEGLRPGLAATLSDVDYLNGSPSPHPDSGFRPMLGRFAEASAAAARRPEQDHLLVLDELNRANVPKALGELLLVMEPTKRAVHDGSNWVPPTDGIVHLTYTGMRFWIPDNLYILATMNTTDRSVAQLDSALRRRFAFVRLEPRSAGEIAELFDPLSNPTAQEIFDRVVETWGVINDDLLRIVIGPDAMLGESYLFDLHRGLTKSAPDRVKEASRDFLRFNFLPQLIDSVVTNGREVEVFGSELGGIKGLALDALGELTNLLDNFDLAIDLQGVGLSRRVVVELREELRTRDVEIDDADQGES
jgi:MoxR-like ATPase